MVAENDRIVVFSLAIAIASTQITLEHPYFRDRGSAKAIHSSPHNFISAV